MNSDPGILVTPQQENLLATQTGSNEVVFSRLDELLKGFTFQMANCQLEASVLTVHDLRVVIRRLIAIMDVLGTTIPTKLQQNIQKPLGSLRDRVNNLRNLQVMAEEVNAPTLQGEEWDAFRVYLQAKVKQQAVKVEEGVATFKIIKFMREVNTLREVLRADATPEKTARIYLGNLDRLFRKINKRLKKIDQSNPLTFHSLRTALRDFRYQYEVVKPLLPGYPEENVKLMKQKQDALGEVQNESVFLAILDKYAEKNPEQETGKIRAYFEKRLSDSISLAGENAQLASLWRTDPDSEFPWQMSESRVENG